MKLLMQWKGDTLQITQVNAELTVIGGVDFTNSQAMQVALQNLSELSYSFRIIWDPDRPSSSFLSKFFKEHWRVWLAAKHFNRIDYGLQQQFDLLALKS